MGTKRFGWTGLRAASVIVRRRFRRTDTGKLLVFGYALYMIVGWALLSLPISQSASSSSLDTLFIAASAVSTTGLVTVDPASSFSFFGELVILLLIQAGGIGYMTISSFVAVSIEHRLSPERSRMVRTTFPMPSDFKPARFVRDVVVFTLLVEAVGAAILYFLFLNAGVDGALWSAVFHSVSAFCTAGFSLNATSFEAFSGHFGILATLSALSLFGAIGFIVISELWGTSVRHRTLCFTSKLILRATFFLIAAATVLLFIVQPGSEPAWQRLTNAFFQAMTASTTVGFNSVPIGDMTTAAILVLMLLMIVGASPSGTGGGLKTTTATVLLASMRSVIKRRSSIRFMKREIDRNVIDQATASGVYYFVVAAIAIFLLAASEGAPLRDVAFEALSALSTVGLSTGLTGELTELGKCVLIILMLMGRAGVLTFALAIAARDETRAEEADNEVVI